jgi:triacylglycerol esterase/lipase EstA (alpha/beta hydrolase family)
MTRPKELLMITVTRCTWAAGVVLIVASVSAACDSPGVTINPDRTTALLPRDERLAYDAGRLETRRPYERGKVPVVFIHGLWGSPRNWDRMIEDLEADPALRARFQFWTVRYTSGNSIPYSAHLLRQSLRQARRVLDPNGTDAAFDRMVVVGHSLGGILAKMMVQSGGPRLWQSVCARSIDQVIGPSEDRQLLRQAYFYKPVPEVRRVIFIATPHRGSPLARGRLCELGTQLCWRPDRFRQAREVLLSHNERDIFAGGTRGQLATSAGELAPGHPLLLRLCDLGVDSSVRSHSVIADFRDPPKADGTDGMVPYSSSHVDGVVSELLVHGLHVCLNHPAVIEEVGRILIEHLGNNAAVLNDDELSSRPKCATPPSPDYTARGTATGSSTLLTQAGSWRPGRAQNIPPRSVGPRYIPWSVHPASVEAITTFFLP